MKKIFMILAVAACVSMTSCGGDDKACNNENCPNKEQCTDCTDCEGQCEATPTEATEEVTEPEVVEEQVVEAAAEN